MSIKKIIKNAILCPVEETKPHLPFPKKQLDPLLAFLENNETVEGEAKIFQRGTVTPEYKLDCCKQDLGAGGAYLLSDALKNNVKIESILFGTGGIGDKGAKSVADLLKENQTIQTVYLGCNLIESKGAEDLAKALENNSGVRALWLKRNPIGDKGLKGIAQLLRKNRRLRSLDLVNTQIGIEGLEYLIETLIEEEYPLERLYLSGNALGPKIGKLLTPLLEKNTHLQELLLSVNCLKNDGIKGLLPGLASNKTLLNLGLSSNGIQNESAKELFKVLEQHPRLQVLDLGYSRSTRVLSAKANELGDDCALALWDFLRNNKQLYHLDLIRNQFTKEGLLLILEGLTNNKNLKELKLGKGFKGTTAKAIKEHLAQNLKENPDAIFQKHRDVQMIKSVYR